jgi:hypothetical protein
MGDVVSISKKMKKKEPKDTNPVRQIFIAGPMTGVDMFNFPAFDLASASLISAGYNVYSPADKDRDLLGVDKMWLPKKEDVEGDWNSLKLNASDGSPFDWKVAYANGVEWLSRTATGIYMLGGWEFSRGARSEHAIAVALQLPVGYEK